MFAATGPDMPQLIDRRRRAWLSVVVVTWGMLAIVTQSLLLREAQVLMFGSEFAWGIVLFAWLLGVAVGAFLGGWVAERLALAEIGLVVVLLALGIASCAELVVFRGARGWLGIEPGELLPLSKTILAAIMFVSPASALVGAAFPLACCITGPDGHQMIRSGTAPGVLQLGRVYALESAGSLIGGALFSFWAVEHLSPIETALCCVALMAAASAGLLGSTGRGRCGAVCLAVGVAAFITSVAAGDALNRQLVQHRWDNVAPGYELCAEVESKYQNLAIGRRAGQFTLYSDGKVVADFPDPYTFVPLAHFWLCQHPAPRRVLVLGGGAEGLLAEILRHPIEHVDYVEPDPRQIELIRPYLTETDLDALMDERVTVHNVDARYFVKTQSSRFDLVIARLPEPTSALRARLYTEEFYGELRRAMTPRSILCMMVAATPGSLTGGWAEYLASIRATLRRHFPYITIGWGNPAQVLAATDDGLTTIEPAELADRYNRRGVESQWFHPAWFDGATDWLAPDKLQHRSAELDAVPKPEISTDLRPIIYVQRLALWEAAAGGPGSPAVRIIERARSLGWFELLGILLLITAVTLFYCYLRTRLGSTRQPPDATSRTGSSWLSNGAIVLSVGSTGFATMALSIIWLFAFQNLYGYVYQRIGWIIALFMGGLVIGCEVVNRRLLRLRDGHGLSIPPANPQSPIPDLQSSTVNRQSSIVPYLWRWLIIVDALLALLALAVPFILPALGAMQSSPLTLTLVEWSISIMVALTGVLGGAAFALAGALQLMRTGQAGAAAGSVVGADHVGACLGALLSGLFLVPVLGTAAAVILLAGIKLSSAGLLVVGCRCNNGLMSDSAAGRQDGNYNI